MRLLGRLFPSIVILVLAVGCQSPVGSASAKAGPGALTVSFATGVRTVVAAGLAATISMDAVHMTCPGQTTIDQTTSGSSSSMTVTSVGAGTWDITVTAQRHTSGYEAVPGAAFTPTLTAGTGVLAGNTVGTVAEADVTSGTYLLRLTFWRGSQSVGTFIEAVNVWDNVTIVMGNNPSNLTGNGLRPVEMVSWYQTLVFCNTLSLEQGLTPVYTIGGSTNPAAWGAIPTVSSTTWNAALMDRNANGYRLPTEMEWRWAAMGATSNTGYTSATGYTKAFAGSKGATPWVTTRGGAPTPWARPIPWAQSFPTNWGCTI